MASREKVVKSDLEKSIIAQFEAELKEEKRNENEVEAHKEKTRKQRLLKVEPMQEETSEEQVEKGEPLVIQNIMLVLVEELTDEYMEEWGVCKCERCKADVKALALTALEAKYVVLEETAINPFTNFYRGKYIGQVIVQLILACKKVKKQPRHNKLKI